MINQLDIKTAVGAVFINAVQEGFIEIFRDRKNYLSEYVKHLNIEHV